jgi:hypothetical protein
MWDILKSSKEEQVLLKVKTYLTKHDNFHNKHVKEVTWGDDKRNTFRKFSRVFSCNNKNETNKIAYSL